MWEESKLTDLSVPSWQADLTACPPHPHSHLQNPRWALKIYLFLRLYLANIHGWWVVWFNLMSHKYY